MTSGGERADNFLLYIIQEFSSSRAETDSVLAGGI